VASSSGSEAFQWWIIIVVLIVVGIVLAGIFIMSRRRANDKDRGVKFEAAEVFVNPRYESGGDAETQQGIGNEAFGFMDMSTTGPDMTEAEQQQEAAARLAANRARKERLAAEAAVEEEHRMRKLAKVRLTSVRVKQSVEEKELKKKQAEERQIDAQQAVDDPHRVLAAFRATEAANAAQSVDTDVVEARRRERAERDAEAEERQMQKAEEDRQADEAANARKAAAAASAAATTAAAAEAAREQAAEATRAEKDAARQQEAEARQARVDERLAREKQARLKAEARIAAAKEAERIKREQEEQDECTNLPGCPCPVCQSDREETVQMDAERKRRVSGVSAVSETPITATEEVVVAAPEAHMVEEEFGFPPT
jgi:hypothetical protein